MSDQLADGLDCMARVQVGGVDASLDPDRQCRWLGSLRRRHNELDARGFGAEFGGHPVDNVAEGVAPIQPYVHMRGVEALGREVLAVGLAQQAADELLDSDV